jgi:hypothetical protein
MKIKSTEELRSMTMRKLHTYAFDEYYKGYFKDDKAALKRAEAAERVYRERGGKLELM